MDRIKIILRALCGVLFFALLISLPSGISCAERIKVRLAYFPNISHSQALIGICNGFFSSELGQEAEIEAKMFNAGPSVIEAMFAGKIDLAYIGPNPAVNGFIRSEGEALRIISGATSGGAALVIRSGAGINKSSDFRRKKIASPQLGNTQDVALRAWLNSQGLKAQENGGDVRIIPVKNPDQLTLFATGQLDAAWTIEPWVSRLQKEAGANVFLEEKTLWPQGKYATAVVIASKEFLEKHPELVRKFLKAHVKLTIWINKNPEEAQRILNKELLRLTGARIGDDILTSAFTRVVPTYEPMQGPLMTCVRWSYEQGFLGEREPRLEGLYDLSFLNQVLKEEGLPSVE